MSIDDSHIANAVDPISLLTARERIELVRNELQEQLLTSSNDALEFSRRHVEIYCHALDASLLQPDLASDKAAQSVEAVDEAMTEVACRAYYNSGVPVTPPVFEAMRAALNAALAHPRPTDGSTPCPGCGGARGGLGPNMGYVPCDDCDGVGSIESDDDTAPAGGHAGEVVAEVLESREDDGSMRRCVAFRVPLTDLPVGAHLYAQPRPVVMPDGWQKIGFIELSALARLVQGSKKAETLFVIGGGCQPQDVYVKLAAAPEVPRG
jgi:hypothetical protein